MSSGKSAFHSVARAFDNLADTLRQAFGSASARHPRGRDANGRRLQRLPSSLGMAASPPRPAVADLARLIRELPPGLAAAPLRELWRALATHGGSLDALPSATLQAALECLRSPALRPQMAPALQRLDEQLQRELLVRGRRRLDAVATGRPPAPMRRPPP